MKKLSFIILIFVVFLPKILSWKPISSYLLQKSPYRITADSIEFHWLKSQKAHQVQLEYEKNLLNCKELELSISLPELLFSRTFSHPLKVKELEMPILTEPLDLDLRLEGPRSNPFISLERSIDGSLSTKLFTQIHFSIDPQDVAIPLFDPIRAKVPSLRFSIMELSLENGICKVAKTAFSVNGVPQFFAWGEIDLKERSVNMEIGLTANLLETVFHIHNLGEDYLLPMKVTGTFEDLHLHKSKALRTIAKLLLKKYIAGVLISNGNFRAEVRILDGV